MAELGRLTSQCRVKYAPTIVYVEALMGTALLGKTRAGQAAVWAVPDLAPAPP